MKLSSHYLPTYATWLVPVDLDGVAHTFSIVATNAAEARNEVEASLRRNPKVTAFTTGSLAEVRRG